MILCAIHSILHATLWHESFIFMIRVFSRPIASHAIHVVHLWVLCVRLIHFSVRFFTIHSFLHVDLETRFLCLIWLFDFLYTIRLFPSFYGIFYTQFGYAEFFHIWIINLRTWFLQMIHSSCDVSKYILHDWIYFYLTFYFLIAVFLIIVPFFFIIIAQTCCMLHMQILQSHKSLAWLCNFYHVHFPSSHLDPIQRNTLE